MLRYFVSLLLCVLAFTLLGYSQLPFYTLSQITSNNTA